LGSSHLTNLVARQPPPARLIWLNVPVSCPVTGELRCSHAVLQAEHELGLHLIDVRGECRCRPEEVGGHGLRSPIVWSHRKLETWT
jgi:hypothetical protein